MLQLFWGKKINDSVLIVEGDDVGHITKSLRQKVGDQIDLIDGSGVIYHCVITNVARNQIDTVVMSSGIAQKYWDHDITLGISLLKNLDRIEWLVEKIVELGVESILFLHCERSQKSNFRIDRINRIVQAAMKQSNNVYMPDIQHIKYIDVFANQKYELYNKFIAHCEDTNKLTLKHTSFPKAKSIVLIGPEGDFTSNEIELAIQNGFNPISLGQSRLRTETAGFYAVAAIKALTY